MKSKIFLYLSLFAGLAFTACNDDDITVNTTPILDAQSVVTGSADVTATTATLHGTVAGLENSSPSSYTVGFNYGTEEGSLNQDITGSIVDGVITAELTGLADGTTIYYQAFAKLQGRVTFTGDVKSIVTTDAVVTTKDAAEVGNFSALLGASVTGAPAGATYGIVISPFDDEEEVRAGLIVPAAAGASDFALTMKGLVPTRTYYYAGYADLGSGVIYGEVKSFTTPAYEVDFDNDLVDLGLSVKWAKYNLGATSESELGGYYGFGDVSGVLNTTITKYYGSANLYDTELDVAAVASDSKLLLPSAEQFRELFTSCTKEWTTVDGVAGYKLTGPNGNSIFLPAAGSRTVNDVTEAGAMGYYQTGSLAADKYSVAYNFSNSNNSRINAPVYQALSVRPVAGRSFRKIAVDSDKVKFNNKDGNGVDGRIEIYNEYGDTKADSPVNIDDVYFSRNMSVTFSIEGINDNLVEGAAGSYKAELSYADASWDPSYWGGTPQWADIVNGDGTYTVSCEIADVANGAVVWCVELYGLWQDLVDTEKVKVKIESINLDAKESPIVEVAVDSRSGVFGNKDGNGVDGRIEIYNEYGDTKGLGVDYSWLAFSAGAMTVEFDIEGIDGNLVEGASTPYKTELSFADASWDPSYWGGAVAGAAQVTGDGHYTVQAHLGGFCEGAVVWTIELYNLWKDLVDTSKVKVSGIKVYVPSVVE